MTPRPSPPTPHLTRGIRATSAPTTTESPPFPWARHTVALTDATLIPGSPVRAALIGTSGSGKSQTLRHLHAQFLSRGQRATLLTAKTTDVAEVASDEALLVDDLHLLGPTHFAMVRARADDPDASLIVALRPWPMSDAASDLVRQIEHTRPAIVLGHLSRSDVLGWLEAHGRTLASRCLEHILEVTGGVSWLVAEALHSHDDRDCADDPAHAALGETLAQQIAHRLDTIDPAVRRAIERLCVAPPGYEMPTPDAPEEWTQQGFAEGLLARNGSPLPLVRSAVHLTISIQRLVDLGSDLVSSLAEYAASGDEGLVPWVGLVRDQRVGIALVRHADRLLNSDPRRAADLYRAALESNVDPSQITGRRAQAAWSLGDIDAAGTIIDDTPAEELTGSDRATAADISAAIWAARGMMEQATAVYSAHPPSDADAATRALIADIGVGRAEDRFPRGDDATGSPSTMGVAMQLLRRGLTGSLRPDASESLLADLVRAAELYTTSRSTAAIPELPAVIAAVAALNLGGPATAAAVLDDALTGGHGGAWARPRLLLWKAWVAVQRGQAAKARRTLDEADAYDRLSARDAMLAQAVRVALARRYDDASQLEAAWRHARSTILRTDVDLFMLHPLAELISSASRVGDTERLAPHFARASHIVAALGDPPLWSAHLHWAGIQQGILRNQPEALAPHAKALVSASSQSRIATKMARAGRVWTAVLGGTVDGDAVESAAQGLASIGLMWDGARLAGHGAGRTDDRRLAARLLACARELHPGETRTATAAPAESDAAPEPTPESLLSERELEVARLVVQGKTYAEIGETIFISPRTAEHHIAHIRRRLGATSRSEVIARLRVIIGNGTPGEDD